MSLSIETWQALREAYWKYQAGMLPREEMCDALMDDASDLLDAARPACPQCNGQGWLRSDEWSDGHSDDKVIVPCPDCRNHPGRCA